ncbi:hypothetical protein [Phytohabitans houttuyneae]|nr:hypothetical protein [Phytohabitans houttuyneae]
MSVILMDLVRSDRTVDLRAHLGGDAPLPFTGRRFEAASDLIDLTPAMEPMAANSLLRR